MGPELGTELAQGTVHVQLNEGDPMIPERTAIVLVGLQNDYFHPEGILRSVVEDRGGIDRVRAATLAFLGNVQDLPVTMISTPIQFTDDYSELVDPVGILKTIRDAGAFRRDGWGGRTIPELEAMGERILHLPGKRGLNAFSNTDLDEVLRDRDVTDVVLAGVVTSVCIDSTGRSAHERQFSVTVLSDCTGGRTGYEQDFYCRDVFPLYAEVRTSAEVAAELAVGRGAALAASGELHD
jgi:nicotinamidase-related amidase